MTVKTVYGKAVISLGTMTVVCSFLVTRREAVLSSLLRHVFLQLFLGAAIRQVHVGISPVRVQEFLCETVVHDADLLKMTCLPDPRVVLNVVIRRPRET